MVINCNEIARFLVLSLFWTVLVAADSPSKEECTLFLAESTIPGAGLGMYTTRHHNVGDVVTWGELVIPIIDVEWNNNFEEFFWLMDSYHWNVNSFAGMAEEVFEGSDITGHLSGIGSQANCMLSLINVDVEQQLNDVDNCGVHRRSSPAAGAFTPYHNHLGIAKTPIRAGSELFTNYGEHYFDVETYGYIPFDQDYEDADDLVERYLDILEHELPNASDELKQSLWDVIFNIPWKDTSRIMNALPRNASILPAIMSSGGTALAFLNHTVRDVEWIRENGKCLDNLRPGTSTIPDAGRGAFATRFIPKGGLIAPAPVIHIPNRSIFYKYDPLPPDEWKRVRPDQSRVIHEQLLVNYCFGHRNSTLLLSLYGAYTNLINHGGPQNANARIVWSPADDGFFKHPEWLELNVSQLEDHLHVGLSFDYVALRDIQQGEEILIDYGQEWQQAWDDHVQNWKPPPGSDRYEAAYELNFDVDFVPSTIDEPNNIPHNVNMWIQPDYREMAGSTYELDEWFRGMVIDRRREKLDDNRKNSSMLLYTVLLYDVREDNLHSYMDPIEVLFSLPRDALWFEDYPNTRDHAMRWSFRHPMMVPDDIFPEAWKNI